VGWLLLCLNVVVLLPLTERAAAQPTLTAGDLRVRTVVSGLNNPTSMAFLGPDEFLVLEKNTGIVRRYKDGIPRNIALDLAVNSASERGLLGIAVHPRFPRVPTVFLYWTCVAVDPVPAWTQGQPPPAFLQSQMTCSISNMMGADSNEMLRVPVMGNRVDRFRWDAERGTLVYDGNLISLRSFQNDGIAPPSGQGDDGQPPRGNHNGGTLRFSQDERLFVYMGDQGRRGQLQNLATGPGPGLEDDAFGGAEPDDDHLTGVVLRLNTDGTAPPDNPFHHVGAQLGGSAGMNLQKIYAYGLRNGFGMAIEPQTGDPWISEHGDDSFDEINRVRRGMNGGWVQFAGPAQLISQFKLIETGFFAPPEPFASLQQWRYPPSRIAATESEARTRLVMYPGAHYVDPEFSWKWAALPVGMAFVEGQNLGSELEGNLIVSLAGRPQGPGYLLRFPLIPGQSTLGFDDPRLQDRVADNNAKYDLTESESLIIGTGFGTATDMCMSPSGTLYVVSFSNGEVYEILREVPADRN
jgi:aldose sugar dehydrogenase